MNDHVFLGRVTVAIICDCCMAVVVCVRAFFWCRKSHQRTADSQKHFVAIMLTMIVVLITVILVTEGCVGVEYVGQQHEHRKQ